MTARIAPFRRIFQIALPIMAANAMVPIIGMVDAWVIGRIDAVAPLAAIGLGAAIMASGFWIFNFLQITTTAALGRARGAGDKSGERAALLRAFGFAARLAPFVVLIAIALYWLAPYIFNTSAALTPLLRDYLGIRLFALPLVLFVHVLTGVFLAREKTRDLFLLLLVAQIVNLILNLIFALWLGWGLKGVALASLIAEILGAALMAYHLRAAIRNALTRAPKNEGQGKPSAAIGFRAYLQNSGALFIRALCLNATILSFQYFSTSLGEVALAINGVLMLFVNFTAQATDGLAVATEVLTSQSIGARDRSALRQNFLRAGLVGFAIAFVLALAYLAFGPWLFAQISVHDELRALSAQYWPWVSASIIIGVVAWSFDGVFFGAERGVEMMITGIIAFALFLICALLLSQSFGNHVLWFAFLLSYVIRAGGLLLYYPRIEAEISAPPVAPI